MGESMNCVPLFETERCIWFMTIKLFIHLYEIIEWSFVGGHLNAFFELELAFEASDVSLRNFDNGVWQVDSLTTKLILSSIFLVCLCAFIIESIVALFETSFMYCSIEREEKF